MNTPQRLLDYEKNYSIEHGLFLDPGASRLPVAQARGGQWWNAASIEMEVGNLLTSLVCMLKPERILETGTNVGYATCKMAMGLDFNRKGSIITMDPLRLDHLWLNTELAKYISFYEKPSTDQDLCENVICKEQYDFIFLDSEHDYGTITYEIAKFLPLLQMHGLMVFHDSYFFDAVGYACLQLQQQGMVEFINLATPRLSISDAEGRLRPDIPCTRSPGLTICKKISSKLPVFDPTVPAKHTFFNLKEKHKPHPNMTAPPLLVPSTRTAQKTRK